NSSRFESLDGAINTIDQIVYGYISTYPDAAYRRQLIARTWDAEENAILAQKNLGYFENKENLDNAPLPRFELRGCPQWQPIDEAMFQDFQQLGQVDSLVSGGLNALGYRRHSYFSLPNGFAMLTPIEQIAEDGKSLPVPGRWQDYPAGNSFSGLLDYFRDLLIDNPGYFRIIAFTVTDKAYIDNNQEEITRASAREWLLDGGQSLPKTLKAYPISEDIQYHIFIYEFSAPEDTKRLNQTCDNFLLTALQHITASGLGKYLIIKP
ncbi:MAG: hypothetical protein AAF242_00260, partial [Bacteroidota bacterium]